jgi:hypothetical protein
MKLRVRNNSIRLRLGRSEVAQFASRGYIEEAIEFGRGPDERFIYALERSGDTDTLQAAISGSRMTISVPDLQAGEWADTDLVGMEVEQQVGGGNVLRVLIEKDFACLEKRDGDEDAFPHPAERVCKSFP